MSELMVNKRRYATEEDDEIQKFLRLVEKDDEEYETYVPLKQRLQNSKDGNDRIKERAMSDESENEGDQANVKQKSLLDIAEELKQSQKNIDQKTLKQIKQRDSELLLLKEANQVQNNALQSNEEIAQGTRYTERLLTSWTAPSYIRSMSKQENDLIRKKWHIIVEGSDCPPPVKSFREMKFPSCVLEALEKKGITRPTPIQVQGCPALLTGRDLIGIAFTGSGKTLTFALPMIMMCLEEELNMPIEPTEGPLGLVLCPSRELARQTYEVVEHFCGIINSDRNLRVQLRSTLCIGGEDKRQQVEPIYRRGVHIVVATPGRLNDLLNQNKLNLDICKYLVLDEADRMLDLGFDEEVHNIINKFKRQRQTVLFSATMPQKFQDFARNTLVDPLVVNVGRAGAANLDVIQEVEYVKQEAKIVYLLECLQKTAPPVIIFCERKGDVDEIQEYLLLKGVSAVSIHGGKDQEERSEAIRLFKDGTRDVLVATDIAAKGLDFPDIQHVINFDMPNEIENYVHRIGRTGRCGKTGVATTFINKDVQESALLDLKHLLIEAKQRVPPVLQALDDPDEDLLDVGGTKGCSFCGGLGHRITDCPKLDKDARKIGQGKKDSLTGMQ